MTDFRKEFLFLFVSTNLIVDSQFLEESCSQDFTPAISHQHSTNILTAKKNPKTTECAPLINSLSQAKRMHFRSRSLFSLRRSIRPASPCCSHSDVPTKFCLYARTPLDSVFRGPVLELDVFGRRSLPVRLLSSDTVSELVVFVCGCVVGVFSVG